MPEDWAYEEVTRVRCSNAVSALCTATPSGFGQLNRCLRCALITFQLYSTGMLRCGVIDFQAERDLQGKPA